MSETLMPLFRLLISLVLIFSSASCSKYNEEKNHNNSDLKNKNHVEEKKSAEKKYFYSISKNSLDYYEKNKEYYIQELFKSKDVSFGGWEFAKKHTANEIFFDFKENEVGANIKYKSPFIVTGKINGFSSGIGDIPYIRIQTDTPSQEISARFKKEQAKDVGALRKGQIIEIWCEKAVDFMNSAVLGDCVPPQEIAIFKKIKLDEQIKKFISGENENFSIANIIFSDIVSEDKEYNFKYCINNNERCTLEYVDRKKYKNNKELESEINLVQHYYLNKFLIIVKNLYGEDFQKKFYSQKKIGDALGNPENLWIYIYKDMESKNSSSSVFQFFKDNYDEAINYNL